MKSLPESSPVKAAIYVRVSTSGQEDNYSPQTQEDACRAYCAQRGFVVAEDQVYREVFSGAALYERPELTRLRQAVAQRQVQAVVSFALDRLSRKQTHVALLVDELERVDCRLLFVTEDFEDGPVGTFIRQAKAFAAELERERIKERTRRGLLARVKSGKPRPGCRAPYGYEWRDEAKSGFSVNSAAAAVVAWIFDEVKAGKTHRWIAAELNRRGLPSPTGRGAWHFSTVHHILANPIYVGQAVAFRTVRSRNSFGRPTMKMRSADEQIPLPAGTAPALIDQETFEVIQARLRLNKERAVRTSLDPEAALLRAGYARCGHCGGALAASRSGRGGQYLNYRCSSRGSDRDCQGSSLPAATLDSAVWSRIRSVLTTPEVIAERLEWMRKHDPSEADLHRVNKQLTQVERERQVLVGHLARLDPDSATLVYGQLAGLSERQKMLVTERNALVRRRTLWDVAEERLDQISGWCKTVAMNLEEMSYQQKRLTLDALGVKARIYRAGHSPRYEIEASIPMGQEQTVSNTR